MNDLLFAVPWWIPSLLAIIGIALFINGNKSQVTKIRNAGAALVLLAFTWALVSYLVDTDKEKVEKGTHQFIQSAVEGKWDLFKSHLAPKATVVIGRSNPLAGSDIITGVAKSSVEMVRLKSARIQKLEIEQTGPLITAHFDLFTQQDAIVPTEISSWLFTWQRGDSGWQIQEIRLIMLNGVAGDQVEGIPALK